MTVWVKVRNGQVTEKSYVEIPGWEPAPDGVAPGHVRVGPNTFRMPEKTLEELKAAKKEEIRNARWEAERAGVEFDGYTFPTDETTQTKLIGAILAAREAETSAFSINWKIDDEYFIEASAGTLGEWAGVVREHVQSCFDREKELLFNINNAETAEEVNAIKWQKTITTTVSGG